MTPRTEPVNAEGVVPLLTVSPVTGWPWVRFATGYAVSQVPVAARDGVDSAAVGGDAVHGLTDVVSREEVAVANLKIHTAFDH